MTRPAVLQIFGRVALDELELVRREPERGRHGVAPRHVLSTGNNSPRQPNGAPARSVEAFCLHWRLMSCSVWHGAYGMDMGRTFHARPRRGRCCHSTKLAASRGIITRRATSSCLRYAPPLAAAAVHSAIVLVAFAGMGGTPVNSSAGNAMKLPPPATEFNAPPSAPARNRKMANSSVKQSGVSETAPRGQGERAVSILRLPV